MVTQCVRNQSNYINTCTYIRTTSTYKRITVRTYVWNNQQSDSNSTHWASEIYTYKNKVTGGEAS